MGCLGLLVLPGLLVLLGLLFYSLSTEYTEQAKDKAKGGRYLPLAEEIRSGPCILVLWRATGEGYQPDMFVKPDAGNEFWVLRVAVCDHGYEEAPVNQFGFSLKADNGVEYQSSLMAPVTKSLPSVNLTNGAWEWGYLGFEVPKAVKRGSLQCAGIRRIVVAHDDKKAREALRQVGVKVPASAMPSPKE